MTPRRCSSVGVITQVEYRVEIRRKPSSFDEGCNAESVGVFESWLIPHYLLNFVFLGDVEHIPRTITHSLHLLASCGVLPKNSVFITEHNVENGLGEYS